MALPPPPSSSIIPLQPKTPTVSKKKLLPPPPSIPVVNTKDEDINRINDFQAGDQEQSALFHAKIGLLDTPEEKIEALRNNPTYNKDFDFGQDTNGNLVFSSKGQNDWQPFESFSKNKTDWLAGHAPGGAVTAAGITGGIIGTPFDLVSGPMGTILGAGIANYGAGLIKKGLGKYLNTNTDDNGTVISSPDFFNRQQAYSAAGAMLGQGMGQAAGPLLNYTGKAMFGQELPTLGQLGSDILNKTLSTTPQMALSPTQLYGKTVGYLPEKLAVGAQKWSDLLSPAEGVQSNNLDYVKDLLGNGNNSLQGQIPTTSLAINKSQSELGKALQQSLLNDYRGNEDQGLLGLKQKLGQMYEQIKGNEAVPEIQNEGDEPTPARPATGSTAITYPTQGKMEPPWMQKPLLSVSPTGPLSVRNNFIGTSLPDERNLIQEIHNAVGEYDDPIVQNKQQQLIKYFSQNPPQTAADLIQLKQNPTFNKILSSNDPYITKQLQPLRDSVNNFIQDSLNGPVGSSQTPKISLSAAGQGKVSPPNLGSQLNTANSLYSALMDQVQPLIEQLQEGKGDSGLNTVTLMRKSPDILENLANPPQVNNQSFNLFSPETKNLFTRGLVSKYISPSLDINGNVNFQSLSNALNSPTQGGSLMDTTVGLAKDNPDLAESLQNLKTITENTNYRPGEPTQTTGGEGGALVGVGHYGYINPASIGSLLKGPLGTAVNLGIAPAYNPGGTAGQTLMQSLNQSNQ